MIARRYLVWLFAIFLLVFTNRNGWSQPVQPRESLSEQNQIGRIRDVQGIVSLRPAMARRWTPVCNRVLLKPKDWVRADARGANAAFVNLLDVGQLILGPGALVEFVGSTEIRVLSGEISVDLAEGATLNVTGPDESKLALIGKSVIRADRAQRSLVKSDTPPKWLAGLTGDATKDPLGSLVATIDGRNVPLTVGYHKVSVDIRDQIARTTIEESFVNHTDGQLEGVFYFPLPQDASISGFGMWINGELVEADIVEKQRAREIYETILREKRDPGLLEWQGGNLFKARVFPIFGNSEKRIKITYTQVLPREGNRFRYGYSLQSELLKQHPLRELLIDVRVSSAVPVQSIKCLTHTAREESTKHAGHVEFSAQEFTPTRDFEVVVELDAAQSPLVVVPHERGEDGYFLLQLVPPGEESGPWKRDLVPEGDPLKLLILADTSASLDRQSRQTQLELVTALLSSLGKDDQFNVAGCDVGCTWALDSVTDTNDESIKKALQFLTNRRSLGWSDLDRSFASALELADANTQIVYVGDGNVATIKNDPVAFSRRLEKMLLQHAHNESIGLHAIAVSSQFESLAMRAIASHGGGSFRQIAGERTPSLAAAELLTEIAQPSIRNLKVAFEGVRTAAVYPEVLPNLVPGQQQVVLGRYLPGGTDQSGEVVVTGTLRGKPIRFTAPIQLAEAENGNSFVPRLWARMHLDYLLQQGSSTLIKQDIIGMSEEFHIITPYTSLLVLESDADRERFGVKRNYTMRDGEQFFADGRENANFELLQQQMRRAGEWRLEMRRNVLAQLRGWKRSGPPNGLPNNEYSRHFAIGGESGIGGGGYGGSRFAGGVVMDSASNFLRDFGRNEQFDRLASRKKLYAQMPMDGPRAGVPMSAPMADMAARSDDSFADDDQLESEPFEEEAGQASGYLHETDQMSLGQRSRSVNYTDPRMLFEKRGRNQMIFQGGEAAEQRQIMFAPPRMEGRLNESVGRYYRYPNLISRFSNILPQLAAPQRPLATESKHGWSNEARSLAELLDRRASLQEMDGAIEIDRRTQSFNQRRDGRVSSDTSRLELFSPQQWLTRQETARGNIILDWCDEKQRGALSAAYQWGATRESISRELLLPPLQLPDFSWQSLERSHPKTNPTIERDGDIATLIFGEPDKNQHRYKIDTKRKVLLSIELIAKHERSWLKTFSDFVKVSSRHWAQKIEVVNEAGERTSLIEQEITALTDSDFQARVDHEKEPLVQSLLIETPLPNVAKAKAAVAAGSNKIGDHLVVLLHHSTTQNWQQLEESLTTIHKTFDNRGGIETPGLAWMDAIAFQSRRDHEGLKAWLNRRSERVADPNDSMAAFAYTWIGTMRMMSQQALAPNEQLLLHKRLKPAYDRQPAHFQAGYQWLLEQTTFLQSANRDSELLQASKRLATEFPQEFYPQSLYIQHLINRMQFEPALAHAEKSLANNEWSIYERDQLRAPIVHQLTSWNWKEAVAWMEPWIESGSHNQNICELYLAGLVRTDREAEANATAERWLELTNKPRSERLETADVLIRAAVDYALGECDQLRHQRIEPLWLDRLAKAVRQLTTDRDKEWDPEDWQLANLIMQHHRFRHDTAVRKTLAVESFARLSSEMNSLPSNQVSYLVRWVRAHGEAASKDDWLKLADKMHDRWASEADQAEQDAFASQLEALLATYDSARQGTFLREQLTELPKKRRLAPAMRLFNYLLSQAWSSEVEEEAFALLPKLTNAAADSAERLQRNIANLVRLSDSMINQRFQKLMAAVENRNKLPRSALKKINEDNLRAAREGFSERLRSEAGKQVGEFAQWIALEEQHVDLLLKRNSDGILAFCRGKLGDQPTAPNDELLNRWKAAVDVESLETVEDEMLSESLHNLMRANSFRMLGKLAIEKNASDALQQFLIEYVREGQAIESQRNQWRLWEYSLQVAFDHAKPLADRLAAWSSETSPYQNSWRSGYAFLQAELGKLPAAIGLLEEIERDDELISFEYSSLADWYLVEDRREEYERSKLATYERMPEHRLQQLINQRRQVWERDDSNVPAEMDPDVLLVFRALFGKSENPANYVHSLKSYYRACRDFRLLANLPDLVVGHTAGQVYPLLVNVHNQLTQEIHEEAAADSILERLRVVAAADGRTKVDARSLDILAMMVERRNAELLNQPEAHLDRSLAAMKRAFDHEWTDGEPRLMAELLGQLGRIEQPELAKEQQRQLRALHGMVEPGSHDHLAISHAWSQALWGYGQHDVAINQLDAAITQYLKANSLSTNDCGIMATHINHLNSRQRFRAAEEFSNNLRTDTNPVAINNRITEFLLQTYRQALRKNGDTSRGNGLELYASVESWLREKIQVSTPNDNSLSWLMDYYRHANALFTRNPATYGLTEGQNPAQEDLRAWVKNELPVRLQKYSGVHVHTIDRVVSPVRDILGAREALTFLIDQIENEPSWLRFDNDGLWRRHHWNLADWRYEIQAMRTPLEKQWETRLLAITLRELTRDLESREQIGRSLFHDNNNKRFWRAKSADFLQVANEVYAQHKKSSQHVVYIADYLWNGLKNRDRAIEMLAEAKSNDVLDQGGLYRLADFYIQVRQFDEATSICRELVASQPKSLGRRIRLMQALFGAKRHIELHALVKETERIFAADGWQFRSLGKFAAACLSCELYDEAIDGFERTIALYKKQYGSTSRGDDTLPRFYIQLSEAHLGADDPIAAIDSASAAIVAWGNRKQHRDGALESLRNALRRPADTPTIVTHLDNEAEKTGLENPLARKTFGEVLMERHAWTDAIQQLEIAVEFQPNDLQSHKKLIEAYQATNDREAEIRQMFAMVELNRRDIDAYNALAGRFKNQNDQKNRERALTSMVEMLPRETESHTALAASRQLDGRWEEAISHWKRVAELREREPTGLIQLANAQLHSKRWTAAEATINGLTSRGWPERFGNTEQEIRKLRQRLAERDD